MKRLLWLTAIFAAVSSLHAQSPVQEGTHMHGDHACNHQSCGLQALDQVMNTHIAPPANFVPGEDRAVVINVTYNGFSPAAQTAFQYAIDIWASQLTSAVPINVVANWTPLGPGTLGSAGPATLYRDFPGAPFAGTWYSVGLANSLTGSDLDPAGVDINCNFNSTFANWYLGTDGNCPAGNYDFVTVVLHELCHGLGFIGLANYSAPNGNIGTLGFNSIWERFVETGPGTDIITLANPGTALGTALTGNDLWWNGPLGAAPIGTRPRTYAPAVWAPGSSYSHLDETNFPAGDPNSLMTYALGTAEVIHNPGPVVLGMFDDMGWLVGNPGCTDPYACNYDPSATIDDGSCDFSGAQWWMPNNINAYPFPVIWSCNAIPGYTLSPYQSCVQQIVNNDPYCQNTDWDNICENALQAIIGCTNPYACNYDPSAQCDDGSCDFSSAQWWLPNDVAAWPVPAILSCNPVPNYTLAACQAAADLVISLDPYCVNTDWDSICQSAYNGYFGCSDPAACNYDPGAACNDGSCTYPGCTNNAACNYNPAAACDDGSCSYPGCTNNAACNYNPAATCDDGLCSYPGCNNPSACNYNPGAGCDDGSCTFPGCTDPGACNYDAAAGCNDGSCQTLDCAGICGGTAIIDDCGNCISAIDCSHQEVFAFTGSEQTYTVPAGVTEITVTAAGGQGGSQGGLGAQITGTFAVTPGEILNLVVGGEGFDPTGTAQNSAGGGGGSFVYNSSNILLVAAGGGGGKCNYAFSVPLHPEANGQAGQNGGANSVGNPGGIGGSGGPEGFEFDLNMSGGGAGWLSNGCCAYGGEGFGSWNGGLGRCDGGGAPGCGGNGAFGGGGGGGNWYGGGGGGGGYSGGAGGADPDHGGGGGSFNGGTNQVNTGGVQAGDGLVIISYNMELFITDCNTGCNDPNAINYDAEANFDNGSCLYLDACQNVINNNGDGSGFFGSMDPSNWTQDLGGGNGSIAFNNNAVTITGSNSFQITQISTYASIVAPVTGTYTFDWNYSTTEVLPFYDPGFYLNGTYYQLTADYGNIEQNGSVSINVNEGDLLGFGIVTLDDVGGAATLTVTNFTYPASCVFGCTDVNACNYDPAATNCDESCVYPIAYYLDCGGVCLNDIDNDGTCDELELYGCDDPAAINYNFNITENDGSCLYAGCIDPVALNYFPAANFGDNTCIYQTGCTYPDADNYNAAAVVDDGSCVFPAGPSSCPEDIDGNGQVNTGDLLQLLGAFGTLCP